MAIREIRLRKRSFDSRINGVLADEILEAIAAAETDGDVVLTLNQAIAVAQVAATIRLANVVNNQMGEMLDRQSFM